MIFSKLVIAMFYIINTVVGFFPKFPTKSSNHLIKTCNTKSVCESKSDILNRYEKLQNQSDIRGVSISSKERDLITLGPNEAFFIGYAFSKWLLKQSKPGEPLTISIGRDCRLSGPDLCIALSAGINKEGNIDIVDLGLCTTPAMFKSCVSPGFDYTGAVMITASHLPMNRNGFKFFTKKGGLDNKAIKEIVTLAGQMQIEISRDGKSIDPANIFAKKIDFLPIYQKQLENLITTGVGIEGDLHSKPLKGLKIVVNAGNGMGGFIKNLLENLGADTKGSLHLEPDGSFPNHLANPELPEAMDPTRKAVLAERADLGIVLDTDVDRSGMVDNTGSFINRNRLIAVMASIVLRDHPGTSIVTDSTSSNGIRKFIENLGGKHVRYMKGYKNVIDKALELNKNGTDCQLAIETSGHGALKENYMLDDGAYMAMKVVIELARRGAGTSISELFSTLEEPRDEVEIRLKVVGNNCKREHVFDQVLQSFQEAAKRVPEWKVDEPNYEGLRVSTFHSEKESGWILLRMSLHDPIIIFNVETEIENGVSIAARKILAEVLPKFVEILDIEPLNKLIKATDLK